MSRVRIQQSRQARRALRCHHRQGRASAEELTISAEKAALATHGHEVAAIAVEIADELDLSAETIDHLRIAGLFHDIGKLWIPDRILAKQGPLTVAEWAVVREHPERGSLMLRAYGLDQEAEWVLHHHERPDGLGYPHGLRGDEIPFPARIIALADAWSAMRSDRPYCEPLTTVNARRELEYTRGEQFDPVLVDVFLGRVEPRLDAILGVGASASH